MPIVNHIFEPKRLYLVWHHSGDNSPRHRRIVGELYRDGESASFRYLKHSDDYKLAVEEGFIGFPAFTVHSNEPFKNAIDVFSKRLPPQKRADFGKYLSQYGLPDNFEGTTLALLGYTGARLASDSFELCADYSDMEAPADLVLEVAGAQYYLSLNSLPVEGDRVVFKFEPHNVHDCNAIAIIWQDTKIGYISKSVAPGLSTTIKTMQVNGFILKTSLRQERIQIMVLAECRKI